MPDPADSSHSVACARHFLFIPFTIPLPFLLTFPFSGSQRWENELSGACSLLKRTHARARAHIYSLSRVCLEKFSMRASKVREVCGAKDGCSEWTEGGGGSYINSCRLRGISSWWKPRRRKGCYRKFADIFSLFFFLLFFSWKNSQATNETQTKIHLSFGVPLFLLGGILSIQRE